MPRFASSVIKFTSLDKLYSFAQCTPIIDSFECGSCLREVLNYMLTLTGDNLSIYAMGYVSSCQLRYDTVSPIVNVKSTQAPHSPPSVARRTPPPPPQKIVGEAFIRL